MKKSDLLWSFLCGELYVLSYPPNSLWPLSLLAFGLFSWLVFEEKTPRSRWQIAAMFATFSFATSITGLYWIPNTLVEFSDFPLVVGWGITSAGFVLMTLPSAATAWLFVPLVQKWGGRRRSFTPKLILLFFFWIFWNYLDYRFFPWSPVQSFGSQPQLLASVGVLGTLGWNLIFYALIAWLHVFKNFSPIRRVGYWLATCALVLGIASGVGQVQIARLKEKYKFGQTIALLQGAVGNFEKKLQTNEPATSENVLRIYRRLIESLALKQKYELGNKEIVVFWPETAFPGFPMNDYALSNLLGAWARLTHGMQLIGAYEEQKIPATGGGAKDKVVQYNIVAGFNAQGEFIDTYRKVVRMPFGEYIPGDQFFPWIYDTFPVLNNFGKGEKHVPIAHAGENGPVFLPYICFEVLSENFVTNTVDFARSHFPGRDLVLVNPTNDSWFGEGAELFLHSHLARWQAAREQLPLVRPTNTGLSMVIAPWGEEVTLGRVGVESLIISKLPLSVNPNPSGNPNL